MNFKAGELYFLREKDYRTGKITPFVKIGIVREKAGDTRTSQERALEHQTGNPRITFVDSILKTDAVQAVENILHWTYSFDRVSGEWFDLTEAEYKKVKIEAENLSKYITNNLKIFSEIEKLKVLKSNGKNIKPKKDAKKWHDQFLLNEFLENTCVDFEKLALAKIKKFEKVKINDQEDDTQNDNSLIKTKEIGARSVFSEEQLKSEMPDLYDEYLTIESLSVKGSFFPVRPKDTFFDLKKIYPDLAKELNSAIKKLDSATKSKSAIEELHAYTLRFRAYKVKASLDKEIALANLKALCAKNDGIEGICTWKRKETLDKKFDVKLFIEQHPDIYNKFQRKIEAKQTSTLKKSRAYKVKKSKIS
jgi:hypothetical protein